MSLCALAVSPVCRFGKAVRAIVRRIENTTSAKSAVGCRISVTRRNFNFKRWYRLSSAARLLKDCRITAWSRRLRSGAAHAEALMRQG